MNFSFFRSLLRAVLTTGLLSIALPAYASPVLVQSMGTANQTVGSEFHLGINNGPSGLTDPLLIDFPFMQYGTEVLDPQHPAWAQPIGSSEWISFTDDYTPTTGQLGAPGDPIQNNDFIWFVHNFELDGTVNSGLLSVLADDTVSIWLNGHQLSIAGGPYNSNGGPTYPTCFESPVGCLSHTQGNYNIASFLNAEGMNTLSFQVWQRNGTGYGLDYSASIDVTKHSTAVPEPSTMLLLGAGVLGGFRRRKQSLSA